MAETAFLGCVVLAAGVALFLMLADAVWETVTTQVGRVDFGFEKEKKNIHHGRFARLWESLTG